MYFEDPLIEGRIPLLLDGIADHFPDRVLASEDHDAFSCAGHRRIEKIPVHEHFRSCEERKNDSRILASLGLMDGDGVGKLEFLQISIGILDESSLVELDRHEGCKIIYFRTN